MTQEGRLFSFLGTQVNGSVPLGKRLISSLDGIHWQYADSALAAQGQAVYEFVATPSGRTLYATTVPANADNADAAAEREFWRSDDAGATWGALGVFPLGNSNSPDAYLTAAVQVGGKMLVYGTTWQTSASTGTGGVPTLHVSTDDGHTWQDSPNAGLPKGRVTPNSKPLGVLPDGTVVLPFVTETTVPTGPDSSTFVVTNLAYYGWKLGSASWVQLTPTIQGQVSMNMRLWLVQPSSTEPAGIWTEFYDGTRLKLAYCRLTS